jgi:hypothetical protein
MSNFDVLNWLVMKCSTLCASSVGLGKIIIFFDVLSIDEEKKDVDIRHVLTNNTNKVELVLWLFLYA